MDKEYWEKFYEKHNKPFKPSPFSHFVCKYMDEKDSVIDLGCGNGRDSLLLASYFKVFAIDQSKNAVDILNDMIHPNLDAMCLKFGDLNDYHKFDHAYSRFTLHSINKQSQDELFSWVRQNISKYFFIEVRSDEDSLVGKETDHYRRFSNFHELIIELIEWGFELIYCEKSKGFSQYRPEFGVDYNEDDPTLIRIVCKNKYD